MKLTVANSLIWSLGVFAVVTVIAYSVIVKFWPGQEIMAPLIGALGYFVVRFFALAAKSFSKSAANEDRTRLLRRRRRLRR